MWLEIIVLEVPELTGDIPGEDHVVVINFSPPRALFPIRRGRHVVRVGHPPMQRPALGLRRPRVHTGVHVLEVTQLSVLQLIPAH